MRLLSGLNHRLKLYAPTTLALVTGQLPLRPVDHLYTPVAPTHQPIPNVVYQTWRDTCFGRDHRSALAEFRNINAEYGFALFDDAKMDRYMADAWGGTQIEHIYRASLFGPLRSDIWRYCILYDRGGAYCDIGKGLSVPFDEVIPTGATAVISFERNRYDPPATGAAAHALQHPDLRIVNWALMSAPGHDLMKRVIDGIVDKYPRYASRVSADPKYDILNFTGPIHLTECVHAHAAAIGMHDVHQAGIDFAGNALLELPGAYVRYVQQRSYAAARDAVIVR